MLIKEEYYLFAAFAKPRPCLTPSKQTALLCDKRLADINEALEVWLSVTVTSWPDERSFSADKKNLRPTVVHE